MVLEYTRNASQKAKVETKIEYNNVFFYEEYKKAKEALKVIIIQQLENNASGEGKEDIRVNNRILFTGQRGSGKTSALLSLKEDLQSNGLIIEISDKEKDKKEKKIDFHPLPMIDPSYFDGRNNIITTVITSLFAESKKIMLDKEREKLDGTLRTNYENLLKEFDKVFKGLGQMMSTDEKTAFTIEKLNNMSDASNMYCLMENLFKSFKNFLGNQDIKFLLVIDDLDMNVDCAADMMEQLRKFLSSKDLIILMSANINQLYNEMCEHYSKAFDKTLRGSNQALYIDVEDLASKYLLKLFPTKMRINVERPVNQLRDAEIKFKEDSDIQKNLQKAILSLIWEKTRLLFVPKNNELHPIIPKNLRELMQFIDFLKDLDEVGFNSEGMLFAGKTDYENCKTNIKKFKDYFLNTWVPTNLSGDEERVFDNIPAELGEINKHLINSINVIGTKNRRNLMSREVDLSIIEKNADSVSIDRDIYTMVSPNDPRFVKANKISDIFNRPSNYSYGDLLLMLDKYETYFESGHDRLFSDAIKIYYSILLFDTMFFDSEDADLYNVIEDRGKETERAKQIIPIQRLIGGTVYYPNYFEIITSKYFKQKGPSYDAKRAFYHKVRLDETDDIPFFSVLYYGDIRPERYDTKHVYDTTFVDDSMVDGTQYITFDILSIFNNMLNPYQTIARANGAEVAKGVNALKGKDKCAKLIGDWKTKCCEIPSEKDSKDPQKFPNAILPFYSVDMMLEYIRQSCDVEEIVTDLPKDFEEKENVANWLGLIDYDDKLTGISEVTDLLKRQWIDFGISDSDEFTIKCEDIGLIKLLENIGIINNNIINTEVINLLYDTKVVNKLLDKLISGKIIIKEDNTYKLTNDKKTSKGEKSDDISDKEVAFLEVLKKENLVTIFHKEYFLKLDAFVKKDDEVAKNKLFEQLLSIRVVKDGNKIRVFKDSIDRLCRGIEVLTVLQGCYKELLEKCLQHGDEKSKDGDSSIDPHIVNKCQPVERFRECAIATIMRLYRGGHREQTMLIKNLHRYNTITEMYRYLVDVLWKDAIVEYCIRQEIQNRVHRKESVGNYYERLKNLTCEKLGYIFDETDYKNETNGTPIELYTNVFSTAMSIFIMEQKPKKRKK